MQKWRQQFFLKESTTNNIHSKSLRRHTICSNACCMRKNQHWMKFFNNSCVYVCVAMYWHGIVLYVCMFMLFNYMDMDTNWNLSTEMISTWKIAFRVIWFFWYVPILVTFSLKYTRTLHTHCVCAITTIKRYIKTLKTKIFHGRHMYGDITKLVTGPDL